MASLSYSAVFKQTGRAWLDDNAARLGAALAFYSILSIGPTLLLVLAAASYIWGHDSAQGHIISQMKQLMGTSGSQAIETVLNSSADSKNGGLLATLFGFLALLFSASGAFGELQSAMNLIWKVKNTDQRPVYEIVRQRFLAFMLVMGSGLLLMLSFFVSTVLSALSAYLNTMFNGAAIIGHIFDLISSLFIISLLFAFTFKFVPDTPIPWKNVRLAAFLTAILFVLGKTAIAFYISHTGVGSSYGAAGSVVILLVWIYYSSQILFFRRRICLCLFASIT